MNILLGACNAKYIHSNLAVYSLRAYADEYREHILLKEYTINQPEEEILGDIYESAPEVIFLSCYIWNISLIKELLADLAAVLPDVPLWVGGPEVSFDAELFLQKHPHVTGVLRGEGEETFRELLAYYVDKEKSLSEIDGITYRDGEIHTNPDRAILDLSAVPFPYRELTDFANRILYYESSRGCPFSCSYCLSSVEKKLRFRDLELVKEELKFFLDRRVPQVKFVDRTFNCNHHHAYTIWKFLLENDNGVTNFHFEAAADLLNEDELALISRMRPGLIQLEIGVQSTNPATLAGIRRQMDFERVAETVQTLQSFGNVHLHLDLIAGLPNEDLESFRKSFNDVYRLQPEQLQLGFLKVLKGSLMEKQAEEYDCRRRTEAPYEVLSTRWLPYSALLTLKRVESMVEVYYNSGQFRQTLAFLGEYFRDAFSFYRKLGEFYREQGYETLSHSRLRRYEILREFALRQGQIPRAGLEERMLCDLYLRENLKSRPAWAPEQRAYEAAKREYFRRHRVPKTAHIEVFRERTLLFEYETRDPLTKNGTVREIQL